MALAQPRAVSVCLATDTQLQSAVLQSPGKQSWGWGSVKGALRDSTLTVVSGLQSLS